MIIQIIRRSRGIAYLCFFFYVFSYFFFTISNICLYNVKEWSVIYDGLFKRGPERLVGICIDKGYKFPLNQCFKAYLFFIFNSLKCLGIDNKSNLYSPRKVICSQLIGDTCFIYLVTSGSILTR